MYVKTTNSESFSPLNDFIVLCGVHKTLACKSLHLSLWWFSQRLAVWTLASASPSILFNEGVWWLSIITLVIDQTLVTWHGPAVNHESRFDQKDLNSEVFFPDLLYQNIRWNFLSKSENQVEQISLYSQVSYLEN